MSEQLTILEVLRTGTEEELREVKTIWPKTIGELNDIIEVLENRQHDYATCAYAMCIAAEATFNYIASKLGTTGFQASCADLEFLRRRRNIKHGFRIINYEDLLYPQYKNNIPTYDELIEENKECLAEAAKELLIDRSDAHPDVINHWKYLVSLTKKVVK